MKIKVIIHEAEEGGYWAEVPSIPGCATQGETFEELLQNLNEAIEGCLSIDVEKLFTNIPYPSTSELIQLAQNGGCFDFLNDELDIYTLEDGEPQLWYN